MYASTFNILIVISNHFFDTSELQKEYNQHFLFVLTYNGRKHFLLKSAKHVIVNESLICSLDF